MKILFCSVGKVHEKYIKVGVEDFTKRINRYFAAEWMLVAPLKSAAAMGDAEFKKRESKNIRNFLQPDDYFVLLDEQGQQLSSAELAKLIQHRANESTKRLVFLIGGAYGVDDVVKRRANYTLSLSMLVFPHMLVRLILAEQVYRACTILNNEKYHH